MTIREILNWHQSAIPTPTKTNQRVMLGVHFEECSEMLDSLTEGSGSERYLDIVENTNAHLSTLATKLKKNPDFEVTIKDREELLDSLADQIVTALGVAYMYGFDIVGALFEVVRSNNSKFVDGKPLFDENGKIKKGPDYFRPNLLPFLGTDPTI
jgi:predicted HAD superfamily Cof-like phosphohydrolase